MTVEADKFMVFDVKSIGLHGEGFAVAFVVIGRDGTRWDEGYYACDPSVCFGNEEDRKWVHENVPHLPPTHIAPQEVRTAFWYRWSLEAAAGAVLAADCTWPVETNFLSACVQDYRPHRNWEGPYPFYDLASMLAIAGEDPLATSERLEDELPAHHPLMDARQSARQLVDLLQRLNAKEEAFPKAAIPLKRSYRIPTGRRADDEGLWVEAIQEAHPEIRPATIMDPVRGRPRKGSTSHTASSEFTGGGGGAGSVSSTKGPADPTAPVVAWTKQSGGGAGSVGHATPAALERPKGEGLLGILATAKPDRWDEPPPALDGRKDDGGKLRWDLTPPFALEEVVGVLTFGARKYSPEGWRTIHRLRYVGALFRHVSEYRRGKSIDPESGRHVLAHALCCLLFILELELEAERTASKEEWTDRLARDLADGLKERLKKRPKQDFRMFLEGTLEEFLDTYDRRLEEEEHE